MRARAGDQRTFSGVMLKTAQSFSRSAFASGPVSVWCLPLRTFEPCSMSVAVSLVVAPAPSERLILRWMVMTSP